MRALLFCLLLSGAPALAVTCDELLAAIPGAFEAAAEVVMTTQILQGEREFAYARARLHKDEAGVWREEVLEQRGQRRPPDSRGEGAEPTFAFSCEGAAVAATGGGWVLTLPEQDGGLPVREWTLHFTRAIGRVVPVSVGGDFEARILFIPFRGAFSVAFSDWVAPR